MNVCSRIVEAVTETISEDRFTANLIAVHALVTAVVVLAFTLRRLLHRGGSRLANVGGLAWIGAIRGSASRAARRLVLWAAALAVLAAIGAGVAYHAVGRDVRDDLGRWYGQLTAEELTFLAVHAAALAGLAVGAWLAVRTLRRLRPVVQANAAAALGQAGHEEALTHWFKVLERFAVVAIRLAALWAAGRVVGLGDWADDVFGFVLRVASIFVVTRLLVLACRALSRTAADIGSRHLSKGKFRRYWERLLRLFPFGQRCFEAAVYVTAASLCVRELAFIAAVADLGPKVVQCIGIFFGTRVVIELLQVLLAEAFGLYREDRPVDQKGRTLVPLLQSVSQYVLYFGSMLTMLGVLGVDTRPILAGAGILGLAVGLGAQNLVTDVVSGFFILFENQYLVGDMVKIGDATGTVEEVGIRVTHIRDDYGKLHIIPNGQIKGVVSYSKGYVNAVVDLKVPAGRSVEGVFRAMAEAGRRLRLRRSEVLADTEIHGLVDFGTSEMTVRAVTKVRPATHHMIQNEYRRLLKEVLDQEQGTGTALKAA
jgi:small conductance mechanosensitive channel